MKNRNWNMWTITISVSAVLLLLVQFNAANPDPTISSELKCYSCDPNTCTGCEWKRTEPKICTIDDLSEENLGTFLLRKLTHIPYSPVHEHSPEFTCQKIEAIRIRDGKSRVVRRCALRLPGNQTCEYFHSNQEKFAKDFYASSTCAVCNTDSCNSSTFNYIWIPILFTSIISCLLIK